MTLFGCIPFVAKNDGRFGRTKNQRTYQEKLTAKKDFSTPAKHAKQFNDYKYHQAARLG